MSTYTWSFGSDEAGLKFDIIYDDSGALSLKVYTGSLDLNALWWGDGDGSGINLKLIKDPTISSVLMNGDTQVWDEGSSSGEKIVWDAYEVLSSPGLGQGTDADGNGVKDTYFTANIEAYDLSSLANDFLTYLEVLESEELQALDLGVRATSTTTAGGSIKWGDTDPVYTPDDSNKPEYWGLSQGFWNNTNGLQDWDLDKDLSFEKFFGVDRTWDDEAPYNNGVPALADVTLLEALNLGGGGQNQLAQQAVAAVLNASDEDMNYRYSVDGIKAIVQNAFDGDDTNGWSIETAQAELEYWNAHAGPNDEGHIYAQEVNTLESNLV